MHVQEALTAAVADIAECEVPESLVRQMGEGECVSKRPCCLIASVQTCQWPCMTRYHRRPEYDADCRLFWEAGRVTPALAPNQMPSTCACLPAETVALGDSRC